MHLQITNWDGSQIIHLCSKIDHTSHKRVAKMSIKFYAIKQNANQ